MSQNLDEKINALNHKIEMLELRLTTLSLHSELEKRIEILERKTIKCPFCGHNPFKYCSCDDEIIFCPMCGKKLHDELQVLGAAGKYAVEGGTGGGQPGN